MSFQQKLVVYYILDYFGVSFFLDINSVLREFILWDQRLSKDCFVENPLFLNAINGACNNTSDCQRDCNDSVFYS